MKRYNLKSDADQRVYLTERDATGTQFTVAQVYATDAEPALQFAQRIARLLNDEAPAPNPPRIDDFMTSDGAEAARAVLRESDKG